MKNSIIFSCFLFFVACHKLEIDKVYIHPEQVEVFTKGQQTYGFASADKDLSYANAPWESSGVAYIEPNLRSKFHLSFNTYHVDGYNRGEVLLMGIPLKKGKNKVFKLNQSSDKARALYTRSADDGDVIGASYDLMTGFDNFIDVSKVDTTSNIAKGTFNLGFVINEAYKGNNYPDTVYFRDGIFDVKFR
jgi:hypothetical protein